MPDVASADKVLPPPSADGENAERYVKRLTKLIDEERVLVAHSDLSKFNVDCLQDHYRINLKNYDVEISHSKTPDKGDDMYVMLFNNLKNYAVDQNQRVILSYVRLTPDQFSRLRASAEGQLNLIKKRIEEKRFREAMLPVDTELSEFSNATASVVDQAVDAAFPTSNSPASNSQAASAPQATPNTNGTTTDNTAPALTPNLAEPPMPDDVIPAQPVETSPSTNQSAVNTAPVTV